MKNKTFNKIKRICYCVSLVSGAMPVYAADDPISVVNNLSNMIFAVVRLIGIIMAVLGAAQFGMSFRSHDPSQRTTGLLSVVGGLIVAFSKEIIYSITG